MTFKGCFYHVRKAKSHFQIVNWGGERVRRTAIVTFVCAAISLLAGTGTSYALQCVPYARANSDITLQGNAWTWWSSAQGQYDRGAAPQVGAVMVFKKTGQLRFGHVAVVTGVEHSRKLVIGHANWGSSQIGGRGKISTGIAVIDISPKNDWSQVRVWNNSVDNFGRMYPVYGFIYPNERKERVVQTSVRQTVAAASAKPVAAEPAPVAVAESVKAAAAEPVKPIAEPVKTAAAEPAKPAVASVAAVAKPSIPAQPAAHRSGRGGAAVAPLNAAATGNDTDEILAKKFGSGQYGAAK